MANAIIYVHGTYASVDERTGISGFQDVDGMGDEEETAIKRLVGLEAPNVYSFSWDGGDTAAKRKEAAAELYKWLDLYKEKTIALVTHSHGGNVAGHALGRGDISVDATYLFACPIMTGDGKAWNEEGSMQNAGTIHTFSHPNDLIQVRGARDRNAVDRGADLGYAVGYQLPGVDDISINPGTYLESSHSAMHTKEAFNLAAKAIGR